MKKQFYTLDVELFKCSYTMYWDIQDVHDLINRERVKKRKVAVSDLAQLIQEDGLESKVLATKTGSDVGNILTCWYKPTK